MARRCLAIPAHRRCSASAAKETGEGAKCGKEATMRQIGTAARLMLFLFLAAVPAWSQGTELKALLAGTNHPLRMRLADLNGDWRELSINGSQNAGGAAGVTYYTKGDTV